jgi:hypothetical protein
MAIFNKTRKAAISPAPIVAAAVAGGYTSNAQGVSMIGQYYSYQEGEARNALSAFRQLTALEI